MVRFDCPKCTRKFYARCRRKADAWGSTMNCFHCGVLLIADEATKSVIDFHEYLHEKNPEWPKDGAGTGSVSMSY